MARRYTGPSAEQRALVVVRDCGRCVVCGDEVYDDPPTLHHRKPRGSGGTSDPAINYPSNLILIHNSCHVWVESRREEAMELGFLVSRWRTPSKWAVLHPVHGAVFLEDDGSVSPADEPDEPAEVVA